jgi:hypothetical protein
MKMTVKMLKNLICELDDETLVCHHAHDKGCCLHAYDTEEVWMFPKGDPKTTAFVMNPGEYYDGRRPARKEVK